MEFNLQGKRALVCASSKGLGLAVAQQLAQEGCDLVICARSPEPLETAATALRQSGVQVDAYQADLSTPTGSAKLAQQAIAGGRPVDVLINNVGGPKPSPAATTDDEAWQAGFNQVFMSAIALTRSLLPGMQERHWGRIVTITSLSVVEPIDHLVVSTAMRAGVTAFHKTLAREVAAAGITVNTVMPGVIHTARTEQLRRAQAERLGTSLEDEMAKTKATIPMGRLGKPEEFAAMVGFLCSVPAAYITGQNFAVDGGLRKGWS